MNSIVHAKLLNCEHLTSPHTSAMECNAIIRFETEAKNRVAVVEELFIFTYSLDLLLALHKIAIGWNFS